MTPSSALTVAFPRVSNALGSATNADPGHRKSKKRRNSPMSAREVGFLESNLHPLG